MPSHQVSKIFIIGGTGAQGIPVVKALVGDKKYQVRVLTRDTNSARAKELLSFGNVELFEGTFADEEVLRKGYQGCDGAFVNIDGFNTGEKAELFWAIRCYEIAIQEGIRFFVYGNLDYALKKSRTIMTPSIEDGIVTWRVPLGDGAVSHVSLEDCGPYVRWLFDNTSRSNGMDLEVAIDEIPYAALATAFEKATGHPARYIDTDAETYFKAFGPLANAPAGVNADPNDKSTMNFKQNFAAFWNVWKYGVLGKRNYELLDEIHPGRIRSAEEFFRREDERLKREGRGGLVESLKPENMRHSLKLTEDGRKGKL
ncbi:hypothetical protein CJF30_00008238 [Rutstroemia sp. NJR-2017a BBW]|nr:hypothetical protein CJF30_00008238 [Rutstroemia sp. NJR-2017a BBW]